MSSSSGISINVNREGRRIKYRDKSETFTDDKLVCKEPIGQFKAWYKVAKETPEIVKPHAMCLGTATKTGIPSVRPVLLGIVNDEGFMFYTNYESRKGRELAENPVAALTFYWDPLRRTVRIEGDVKKASNEVSNKYFASMPFDHKIGAYTSKQSTVITSRESLIIKERKILARFSDGKVPRPPSWGCYILIPKTVEFWHSQPDRLHDRIRFRRPGPNEKIDNIVVHQGEKGWVYERLSP